MKGECRLPNIIDLFAGAGGLSLGAAQDLMFQLLLKSTPMQ